MLSTSPARVPSVGAKRRVAFSPLPGELEAEGNATTVTSKSVDLPPPLPPRSSTQRPVGSPARQSPAQRATVGGSATAARHTDTSEEGDDSLPATASHRTRSSDHPSPSRDTLVAAYQRKRAESPSGPHRGATTALEFSLQDTPLLTTMAPPVWREPSPSTHPLVRHSASSARLSTPGRRATTGNNGDNTRTAQDSVTSSRASAPGSNPFTDVERELTNQKRRHVVVRHFFASHEDAIRLYIHLEQLLQFRDLCETEFRERLAALPTEEARAVVLASRGARGAAGGADKEIHKLQAALAQATAASPELSSTLSSLRGFTPPPVFSLSDAKAEEPVVKPKSRAAAVLERLAADRAGRAHSPAAPAEKSAPSSPADRAADATKGGTERKTWRGTPNRTASPRTRVVGPAPGTSSADSLSSPGTSPKPRQRTPSQPSGALEAWRNARKDGTSARGSAAAAPAPDGATPKSPSGRRVGTAAGRGRTPPSHRATSPVRPPMSPPRKPTAAPVSTAVTASPLRVASPSESGNRSASRARRGPLPSLHHMAPAATSATSPPPRVPAPPSAVSSRSGALAATTTAAAAAASTVASPPREATPLNVAALVNSPGRRTPLAHAAGTPLQRQPRRGSSASASLTDSPLARYRAQHGYQDPTLRFLTQAPLVTPHDSPSSLSPRWGASAADEDPSHAPPQAAAEAAHASMHTSPAPAVMRMATPGRRWPVLPRGDASTSTATSPPRFPPLPGTLAAAHAPAQTEPLKLSLERSPPTPSSTCPVKSSPGQSGVSDVPTTSHLPHPRAAAAVASSHEPADTAPPSELVDTAQRRSSLLPPFTLSTAEATTAAAAAAASAPSGAMRLIPQRGQFSSSASLPQVQPLPSESLPSEDMSGWSPVDPPVDATESNMPPVVFQRHQLGDAVVRTPANAAPAHGVDAHESCSAPPPAAATSRLGEAPSQGAAAVGGHPSGGTNDNNMGLSVWDEIAALERRVGGLESRTTALEKNAAKRAVLEAIRLLKRRVGTLEERTSALEVQERGPPLHLNW